MEKEDSRVGLLKYYKFVKVCSLCKKEYGVDKDKFENGICPPCCYELNKKDEVLRQ